MKSKEDNAIKFSEEIDLLRLQLKEAKGIFNNLFINLADEVHLWKVVKDHKGKIKTWTLEDVNPAALLKWGKEKEDVIGKTTNEIFDFDATSKFMPVVKKIFKTNKPYKWVEYFEPTNEYLNMVSIPLGDYFISTGEDISEIERAEQALRKSEVRYKNIAENFPGVILQYALHPDGTDELLYINKGVENLYEVSVKDALANNQILWDRVHPDDKAAYLKSIKKSAETLSKWDFENRLLFPDNRIKWISNTGIPTKQENGKVIWDSFAIDITKRIKNKEKLSQFNQQLEKEVSIRTKDILEVSKDLEIYKLAAEHSESGVWYFDLKLGMAKWDDTLYKMYEVEKNKNNNYVKVKTWENRVHPEDRDRVTKSLANAIERKQNWDSLFRIVLPSNGAVKHIRAKGKIDLDANGETIGAFGTNWDVTREMRLAEEKEDALKELKEAQAQLILSEKMASLGMLTSGIAHEINNPLNYILGSYKAIEKYIKKTDSLDKKELQKYLGWISVGAERITEIVKSINQISKTNDFKPEICNVENIVDDCILALQFRLRDHVKVKRNYHAKNTTILGNTGKLHQVMLNILNNAIDASPKKGKIIIETTSNETFIEVKIIDNGIGINKTNLLRVTDPFFTTKEQGEGTGLGLSIAKSIVEEHSGELSITSKVNNGTTVSIKLPNNSLNLNE